MLNKPSFLLALSCTGFATFLLRVLLLSGWISVFAIECFCHYTGQKPGLSVFITVLGYDEIRLSIHIRKEEVWKAKFS